MTNDEKLFYTIGEVAKLLQVKPYVLRYWETEFELLAPQKSSTGQRVYKKRDVEMALTIKRLLHEEHYTIVGAKLKLAELDKQGLDQLDMFAAKGQNAVLAGTATESGPDPETLHEMKKLFAEMEEIFRKYAAI